MTFRQVQAFVKRAGTVFLATTDGRRPQVRPMAAYAWFDGELWMATGARSVKARDVRGHPAVEVCAMTRTFCFVRIEGVCRISRGAAEKKRMFGAFPWMKNYFGSATHPSWVVLRIVPRRIRAMGKDMEVQEVELPG